jgi:hypothetical protein
MQIKTIDAPAYWIWYPGDFEKYHAMKQNFSRVERGCSWPAFWKSEGFRNRVAFRRNGLITAISKSDGKGNSLEIEIEFTALTPWYKIISQHNDGSAIGGKVYDYQYDYQYTVAVQNSVTVDSDSYQSSPVKLIIYGPAANPSWRYYLNGNLQTSGKVNGTVLDNHILIIDTTTIPYSIKQFDLQGNLVSDMYQQSDFSTGRFVRFSKGRNTITVQAENTNKITVGVEAQIEYATV